MSIVLTQPALFPFETGRQRVSSHWFQTTCTDPWAGEMFKRHYSCRRTRKWGFGNFSRFIGPGEYSLLVNPGGAALFAWRRELWRQDGQTGINCSVFRNEGTVLSSTLILEAMQIAWQRWPGQRLYTFVDPKQVRSENPGYCFIKAGWRRCGITKCRGLVILEALPE